MMAKLFDVIVGNVGWYFKVAGTIARDIVCALYGLDEQKLTEKFKQVIFPIIKRDAIKLIYRHCFLRDYGFAGCDWECAGDRECELALAECKKIKSLSPEEAMRLAEAVVSTGENEVPVGIQHMSPELFNAVIGQCIRSLASYVEVYKFIKSLEQKSKLSVADINLLMDYLHVGAGLYFKYMKQFGMNLDAEDYLAGQIFSYRGMDQLLDGLMVVVKNDPEVSYLLEKVQSLKEKWIKIKENIDQILDDVVAEFNELFPDYRISTELISLGDIVELFKPENCSQLPITQEFPEYYNICYESREQLVDFLKELNDVLVKLGGGSLLFNVILFAGKSEFEPELRSVLPFEEKKELHYQDLVNKQQTTYRDQRQNPEKILTKYWCNYLRENKIGKFINEAELYLAPFFDNPAFLMEIIDNLGGTNALKEDSNAVQYLLDAIIFKLEDAREQYEKQLNQLEDICFDKECQAMSIRLRNQLNAINDLLDGLTECKQSLSRVASLLLGKFL